MLYIFAMHTMALVAIAVLLWRADRRSAVSAATPARKPRKLTPRAPRASRATAPSQAGMPPAMPLDQEQPADEPVLPGLTLPSTGHGGNDHGVSDLQPFRHARTALAATA